MLFFLIIYIIILSKKMIIEDYLQSQYVFIFIKLWEIKN